MNNNSQNQGFIIKFALFVIAIIILLSLFKVKISSLMDNEYMQENFGFVWEKVKFIWYNYMEEPAGVIYNLFHKLIWEPIKTRIY